MFTSCVDPLLQTNAHPGVTFFDEPEMHEFTSDGGHADFDNGVEVTVPTSAVTPGSTVHITVQPSLAPRDVFVLPEGIASASPSYLISGEGLSGEVTLSMEHHVQVTSNEDANNLVFLQADPSPKRSGAQNVYKYHEVPVSSSQFTPGENNGILRRPFSKKQFIKVGFRKTLKKLFRGDWQLYVSIILLMLQFQLGLLVSLMTPQSLRVHLLTITSTLLECTSLLHRRLETE